MVGPIGNIFFDFTSNISGTANVRSGESTGAQYQLSPIDEVKKLISTGSVASVSGYTLGGISGIAAMLSGMAARATPVSFHVYISGGATQINNLATNTVMLSGTDAATTINSGIAGSPNGCIMTFSKQEFQITTSILVPTNSKPYVFRGDTQTSNLTTATQFTAVSGMSDQTFIINAASGVTVADGSRPILHVSDIFFYNSLPNTSGNATPGRIDVGGIKIEGDNATDASCFSVERCNFGYIWRGIETIGTVTMAVMRDLYFHDFGAATFKGDYGIYIHNTPGHTNDPKLFHLDNIRLNMLGVQTNGIRIQGAYHHIQDFFFDGGVYTESAIAFHGESGCNTNTIVRAFGIDLNTNPNPDTRTDGILLTGPGCFGNRIIAGQTPGYPRMIRFASGALNNDAELSYDGSNVTVNDTTAGPGNEVTIYQGARSSGIAFKNLKVTTTASNTLINDNRPGATVFGSATVVSGGTSLVVSNATFDVISKVQVLPTSNTSGFTWWVSGKVSGAFSVFASPSAFSGGFTFDYMASVYP